MIRVLLAPGSAAAANGITADVDVLLAAGSAEFGGDDFTVNTSIDAGAATGEGFSAGIENIVPVDFVAGAASGD
jgi:hypothetical protein